MEMQNFQFVEVKRFNGNYRIFLKDSIFIGNYTEWEALLVANALERALRARQFPQLVEADLVEKALKGLTERPAAKSGDLM